MQLLSPEQVEAFGTAVLLSGALGQKGRGALMETFVENVLDAVKVVQDNPATGEDVACHLFEGGAKSIIPDHTGARPAMAFLKSHEAAETKAPIIIAYIGETHRFGLDRIRSSMLWGTFNAQTKGERLIVLERGMVTPQFYHAEAKVSAQPIITEENMTGTMALNTMASEQARSIIAAAYLFLCVANGRQDRSSRVLVLFGQNHIDDMVEAFEYFALNCKSITSVRKRSRGYFTMTSQKG